MLGTSVVQMTNGRKDVPIRHDGNLAMEYAVGSGQFDLHVLVDATPQGDLVRRLADTLVAQELRLAYDRALEITFEQYQGQVLEFLEGEAADRYGTESAWDEIRLQAASLLERVMERQGKPR